MSADHRCGPTVSEILDASLRGEVLGTWERCDECQAREDALLEGVPLIPIIGGGGGRFRRTPITPIRSSESGG